MASECQVCCRGAWRGNPSTPQSWLPSCPAPTLTWVEAVNSAYEIFPFSRVRQEVRPVAAPCGFLPSSHPPLAPSGSSGGRGGAEMQRCRPFLSQDARKGLPLPQCCCQPSRSASVTCERRQPRGENGRGPVLGAVLCVPTLASHRQIDPFPFQTPWTHL